MLRTFPSLHSLAVLAVLWAFVLPAQAASLDWADLAAGDTVEVVTSDADGDVRETTIWLLALDGTGYIRTSKGSTWGDNVERQPDITLRAKGADHPVHAIPITDEAEKARIVAGFEAKYGHHPILDWFRGEPRIWRLEAR